MLRAEVNWVASGVRASAAGWWRGGAVRGRISRTQPIEGAAPRKLARGRERSARSTLPAVPKLRRPTFGAAVLVESKAAALALQEDMLRVTIWRCVERRLAGDERA